MWILRRATEVDRDALADMYMMDFKDNYIHALLFANNLVENQMTILCFHEKDLAGVLCWGVRGLLENGICEITHLIVRPSFQRKSAGIQLVDEAITIAEKYYEERGFQFRLMYSFLKKKNTVNGPFLKSNDFVRVSEITSFYPDDDAVIWIRYLGKEK